MATAIDTIDTTIVIGMPPRMKLLPLAEELKIDLVGGDQAADDEADEDQPGAEERQPELELVTAPAAGDCLDDRRTGLDPDLLDRRLPLAGMTKPCHRALRSSKR